MFFLVINFSLGHYYIKTNIPESQKPAAMYMYLPIIVLHVNYFYEADGLDPNST